MGKWVEYSMMWASVAARVELDFLVRIKIRNLCA